MTIRTILAAIDLTPGSARVAARARQLAQMHGARIIGIHVIEGLPDRHAALPAGVDPSLLVAALEDDGHARLRAMLGEDAGLHVEQGRPHEAILGLARRQGADLVVIGPGVAQGLRERVFGSTADRVTRCAPCPVLIVRHEADTTWPRALTGLDFSEHARAAALAATRIAPGARQVFVHADEIPLGFEQSMLKVGTSQAEITRYRAARARNARRRLRESLAQAGIAGTPDIRIRPGDPAAVILAAARRSDLVVIGTQGMNAVSERILGSVARKVLMQARGDVLAVPGG
ncbi:MAG: universal stress protein [Rubellimicrobium sp.]|nr:universal stress protein [Rubellimicrobium sp.]